MSLDALRIALQGLFDLTPIAVAVQGLIAELKEEQKPAATGYAKAHVNAHKPNYDAYVRMMNEQFRRAQRMKKEDQFAVEFIAAIIGSEVLYG